MKTFKTIRQVEKVGFKNCLYSNTKTSENFLNEKNVKITERDHTFKGFTSTYNVVILITSLKNYNFKILNLQVKVS